MQKIATGIGYKNPRYVGGKLVGTKYEYPIYTQAQLAIIKSSGGEVK
jgi:hypothetical protein